MSKRIASILLVTALCLSSARPLLANGRMEDTRQSFYHEVTDAYNEVVKDLEAGNTRDGADAAKRLHTLTGRLLESLAYLEKSTHDLSPILEDAWRPAMSALGAFNATAARLELIVGVRDFKDELSTLKDTFSRSQSEWEKAYDKFKEFGKKFSDTCDSCH